MPWDLPAYTRADRHSDPPVLRYGMTGPRIARRTRGRLPGKYSPERPGRPAVGEPQRDRSRGCSGPGRVRMVVFTVRHRRGAHRREERLLVIAIFRADRAPWASTASAPTVALCANHPLAGE
jgi:hypothetical protein